MAIIYRMITNPEGIGHIESYELEQLEQIRAQQGKTSEEWPIRVLEIKFNVSNDPELRQLDTIDEAYDVMSQLNNETFQIEFTKTILTPQPDGFPS